MTIDDKKDDEEEDLASSLSRLKMSSQPLALASKVLMYSAWVNPPQSSFMSSILSETFLLDILSKSMKIDIAHHEISALKEQKSLPKVMRITPFVQNVPAEPKPNMLMAVASLLTHQKKRLPEATAEELVSSLGKYDVVIPRKPLQKLLSLNSEEFQTYAFRPSKEAPLFIDRVFGYSTNPGTVGMQFEKNIVNPPETKLHRTYGIFQVDLSDRKLIVTGEVDGINTQSGTPIEIKTKPAWARPDAARLLQSWAQCAIANVDTVVTGSFSAQRGVRNGPVTFDTSYNVVYEPFSQFARKVYNKERGLKNALDILDQVLETCHQVGVVYRVSSTSSGTVRCQKLDEDDEYDFPMSQETIDTIADLVAKGKI
jgi:hypothetical protein